MNIIKKVKNNIYFIVTTYPNFIQNKLAQQKENAGAVASLKKDAKAGRRKRKKTDAHDTVREKETEG